MSDALYPKLVRGLAFSVLVSPAFDTLVQSAPGREIRIAQMRNPIRKWTLTYEYLKDLDADLASTHNVVYPNPISALAYTDLQTLRGFYLARGARADSFLFYDWTDVDSAGNEKDGVVSAGSLQLITDGNGNYYSPVQVRRGGLFYEDVTDLRPPITANVYGTRTCALAVYLNGILQYESANPYGTLNRRDYNVIGPGMPYWQALHGYQNGNIIRGGGHCQRVKIGNSSLPTGATEPLWNTSGGTTVDGYVTWEDLGFYVTGPWHGLVIQWTPWLAAHAYAANATLIDSGGHLQKVTAGGGGNSGATVPSWNHAGSTTSDGALTWTDQGHPTVTATFNCYYRVHFNTDEQAFERFMRQLWAVGSGGSALEIIQARPPVT